MDKAKSEHLTHKAVKGVFWNYGAFMSSKLITFIVSVMLARVLSPEDFGLVAICTVVITYFEILNNFGIDSAFIYFRDETEDLTSVTFVLSIILGIILTLLTLLVAPLVASFFNEPRVIEILSVLSVTFIISSFRLVPATLLRKRLEFKKRFIPQLGRTLTKGVVSIGMALTGFGVWSLVWGTIASILVETLLYFAVTRWIPTIAFKAGVAWMLLKYGVQLVFVDFFGAVNRNIDYFIVGKRLSTVELGFYTLGFKLPELLIINISTIVADALFPAYSKIQNDLQAIQRGFLMSLRYVSLITIPLGVGIMIVSPDFIVTVYTDRWLPTIPVMQALAIYAAVVSLGYNAGVVYKAIGRPSILNKLSVIKLSVTIPILWISASYGIVGVAVGQLVASVILTTVQMIIAHRVIEVAYTDILKALYPATIACLAMATGLFLLRTQLEHTAIVLRLFTLSISGIIIYFSVLWFTSKESITDAIQVIRPVLLKR